MALPRAQLSAKTASAARRRITPRPICASRETVGFAKISIDAGLLKRLGSPPARTQRVHFLICALAGDRAGYPFCSEHTKCDESTSKGTSRRPDPK